MQPTDLIHDGVRSITICNSCRYCEGFCAVFPAIERRMTFAEADMNYLANLCHNCTECLRSCQYAPPHSFAVNISQTLARIRLRSYEQYCWPRALGWVFRHHNVATVLVIATLLSVCMAGATRLILHRELIAQTEVTDFYRVIPHGVMAGTFGVVFLMGVTAMAISIARFVKHARPSGSAATGRSIVAGLRDALTLKYLHNAGDDCAIEEDIRAPWRRFCHHLTFYGFLLCFASTTVAASYSVFMNWNAPYPFFSIPVLLGTSGGIGLVVGPVGLWALRVRRDLATMDSAQTGLDLGFILMLVLTSVTGLALLAFRDSAQMGILLIVHLAFVLTLFVTLPYGKFMHGLYRMAALIQFAHESQDE